MLRVIRRSFAYLPIRERWKFRALLLATLAANSLDIVGLLLVGYIGLVASGGSANLPVVFQLENDPQDTMLILVVIAGIVFTAKTAIGIWLARVRYYYLAQVEVLVSRDIARSVFLGEISEMKKNSRGSLEWTIIRSTNTAFTHVLGQAFQLFSEVTLAISIYVVFVITDWTVALAVLAYLGLLVLGFQFAIRNANSKAGKKFSEATLTAMQSISDFVSAFREIKVSNVSSVFLERLHNARAKLAHAQARQSVIESLPRLILEMALVAGVVALVSFELFRSDSTQDSDYQSVAIFLVGTLRLMSAMLPLQRAFMALRYAEPQAEAAHEAIANISSPEEYPASRTKPLLPKRSSLLTPPSVLLQNVSFAYPDDSRDKLPSLDSIKLSLNGGTSVGVIGPSGAGKSTLIDIMLGLHSPTSGEVTIGGMSPQEYRRHFPGAVSYVPQKPGLVAGSLRDNVALGVAADEIDEDRINIALEQSGLSEFVYSLPGGIDTSIGAQSDSLSGGQIQRLGIARAIYPNPSLLVLDEGTSALDPETEELITAYLSSLSGKVTLIVVAHRLTTVKNLDQVVFLDKGQVAGQGPLDQLRLDHPTVDRYVRLLSFD